MRLDESGGCSVGHELIGQQLHDARWREPGVVNRIPNRQKRSEHGRQRSGQNYRRQQR